MNIISNYLKDHQNLVVGYFLLTIAIQLLSIYLPHLYGDLVATITINKKVNPLFYKKLAYIFICWIALQLFWAKLTILNSMFIPNLREYIRLNIIHYTGQNVYAQAIFGELQKLPTAIDRIVDDITTKLLPMGFILVFTIGYLFLINPILGFCGLLSTNIFIWTIYISSQKCIAQWSNLHDSNIMMKISIEKYSGEYKIQDTASIKCAGNFKLIAKFAYISLFFAINMVAIWLYTIKKISLANLISILLISLQLITKMTGFIEALDNIIFELYSIKYLNLKVKGILKNL